MKQSKSIQHLHSIHIQDEYGTPKELFQKVCQKYNIWPQIDICASHINHVLDNHITKEQDCFNYQITEDFFMNPPYSRISDFMEFAYEQHHKHNVSGLILTYSKTDTVWWHKFVENHSEIHFIKGRVRFLDEFGNRTNNVAPYPSCWIVFRKTI